MERTFNPGLAYHEFRQVRLAYQLAALVAFLMSSYFVVGYLAGNMELWTWTFSQWLNGLVGFGLTGVLTAFQFFLYSRGELKAGRASTVLAVFVAAGFSLLSEVGQGVERDHVRMESKSLESPTYQALIDQLGQGGTTNTPSPNPYAYQLQQAETLLARCQEKVEVGIWNDCNESQARVTAVEKLVREYYRQEQAGREALADKAKTMERDESNYHPLVNFIRQVFGVSGITGSFLLSLLIIGCFEYAFHFLGGLYASHKTLLLRHGFDVTTRARTTPLPVKLLTDKNQTDKKLIDLTRKVDNPVSGQHTDLTSKVGNSPENGQLEQAYAEWKRAVVRRDLAPTFPPTKKWLQKAGIGESKPKQQDIAEKWLERLAGEGGIIANPDAGTGKPKYLWK